MNENADQRDQAWKQRNDDPKPQEPMHEEPPPRELQQSRSAAALAAEWAMQFAR